MQIMNIVPKNSRHVVIVAYRRATYNHSSFFETIHSWFAIVESFFQNSKFFEASYECYTKLIDKQRKVTEFAWIFLRLSGIESHSEPLRTAFKTDSFEILNCNSI